MKNLRLTILLISSFLFLTVICYPSSKEFWVSTNRQYSNQFSADVAISPEGEFIIVWQSDIFISSDSDICALEYDRFADPYDEDFIVNDDPSPKIFYYSWPSIAMNTMDEFIVAWKFAGIGGVRAKKFTGNEGVQFDIPSCGFPPHCGMDGEGNFIIITDRMHGSRHRIEARKYDRECNLIKSFSVSSDMSFSQLYPDIAMNANGNFVVAWQCPEKDGSIYGVYARRFDKGANPIGDEFQVNTTTYQSQHNPAVAMAENGNFVIVWESYSQDESKEDIYAQLYDSAGNPIGSEFLVNTYTYDNQDQPAVAMDSIGNFVVAWRGDVRTYQEPYGIVLQSGIYARRFDYNGNPIGKQFKVNSDEKGEDRYGGPSVAMDRDGDFVISWTAFRECLSEHDQVFARYYHVNPIIHEPSVDISANGTTFKPNNTVEITVTVDCRYEGAVDMYAGILLPEDFFWYPMWGNIPYPTVFEDEKKEEMIAKFALSEDRLIGTYTLYAAITTHHTYHLLDVDSVTITIE